MQSLSNAGGMVLFFVAAVFPFHPADGQVLVNGGFEEGADASALSGWNFGCSCGCQGSLAIDIETKSEGARSVRLSSASDYGANIYCGLAQTITGLTPGQTYRVSFRAKGENAGVCWFGGGPGWLRRKIVPEGSFDWRTFSFEWPCESGQTTFEFRVNVDSYTQALWIDDVQATAVSADDPLLKEAIAQIGRHEERAGTLRAAVAEAAAQGLAVAYPRADIAIAGRFCTYARDDIAHSRFERALEVVEEVGQLLDRAAAEMKDNVEVPVLKQDAPIEIRDGSLWAECMTQHGTEKRPVFLTGYGHFQPAIDDLPLFSEIGINIIQIEIGPNSSVFEDGVHTEAITERIGGALDRAQANGVRVCVLLSPHYFPEWALSKWPELKVSSGFLPNAVDAPEARAIYRKHIEAVISVIKNHPALHSICLSNEPVSLGSAQDPFRLPLWHAYIARKHGTIAALNAAYGTSYSTFDDVPHPALSLGEKRAPLYDAVRFNQEAFAEWHAWMVETIHAIAPDLPCHAKVMMLPTDRATVLWGTDPWDFAKLSQLNGNDCANIRFYSGHEWVGDWRAQNMYYDLQRSMKRVPIFNTENHIIPDRCASYIPPVHVYAAIWQGAIHGQGASTTWAWHRTYDPKQDFEGLILHRAGCTAAMSRCGLDLMRLSKEVAALQNLQASVALLYSHAATIADSRHVGARTNVYQAVNFCGIPIAFITDEQIAAGGIGQYKCLFVAGAKAASAEAINGMREWAAASGRIVAYDTGNLVEDEYGRPATPPVFAKSLAACSDAGIPAMRDEILAYLTASGLGPERVLRTEDGAVPYGVEWRSAISGERTIVNMINYRRTPAKIQLADGHWTDLTTNRRVGPVVTLEPETPLLAACE